MFKNAIRNIFHYKGQNIAVGLISLFAAALSCIALAVWESAAKAEQSLSGMGLNMQGVLPYGSFGRNAVIALVVILLAGGIALIALGFYRVHKRRNEIGTLTVMGMKKGKIAMQYAAEIFIVTMVCALIGTAVGFAAAAPASSVLMQMQVSSQRSRQTQNYGNWQQNGYQQGGNQNNGNQANGNQANGNQSNGNTNGNQVNGNQANVNQANGNQASNSQVNGNQTNGNQGNGNRANRNSSGSNQANGNQTNGDNQNGNTNQGSGNGRSFGQGQRSGIGSRNFNTAPDVFVILETIGAGLLLSVLSGIGAGAAVQQCEPLKILSDRK